jgi:hypothetical protein
VEGTGSERNHLNGERAEGRDRTETAQRGTPAQRARLRAGGRSGGREGKQKHGDAGSGVEGGRVGTPKVGREPDCAPQRSIVCLPFFGFPE